MSPEPPQSIGQDLSERERQVLQAVVRTYVDSAEPAGSRTLAKRFDLGVSPATVRNTMSDLESKGYLFHRHTSAGRIPTDLAYRFYVDRIMRPRPLTEVERERLVQEIEVAGSSAVERLVQRAIRALSLLSGELGVAVAPSLEDAILERLELIQVSSAKILMVMSIKSGLVHTVYVDLPGEVQSDVLASVTQVLNERLAGLTLHAIRETLLDRLRDTGIGHGGGADEAPQYPHSVEFRAVRLDAARRGPGPSGPYERPGCSAGIQHRRAAQGAHRTDGAKDPARGRSREQGAPGRTKDHHW